MTEERAVYSYERELARSVDAVGDECLECGGGGLVFEHTLFGSESDRCPICEGTGRVLAYDAMDDADDLYERVGDR
jgi:hypothetical protein